MLLETMRHPLTDPYYATGAMQLLVLRLLRPREFVGLTERISRSSGPEGGVFVTFERALAGR